jgi:hypothetical protein
LLNVDVEIPDVLTDTLTAKALTVK